MLPDLFRGRRVNQTGKYGHTHRQKNTQKNIDFILSVFNIEPFFKKPSKAGFGSRGTNGIKGACYFRDHGPFGHQKTDIGQMRLGQMPFNESNGKGVQGFVVSSRSSASKKLLVASSRWASSADLKSASLDSK